MDRFPVRVHARPDAPLSRWLWLVKWLLLLPHYLVLAGLWIAFVVMTLVGYVAVLFTGRYPRSIFEFNVGVLRWTWRVGYYGYEVLGTDRYPPFSLAPDATYPADLEIDYPDRLPRWLPLVAWLFVAPHMLIVAAFNGAVTWQWSSSVDGREYSVDLPAGVVSIGIAVVAVLLAVTGRHPRGLYDLLVGIARWSFRAIAYASLLTGRYPPFRLDQGGAEPIGQPPGPLGSGPGEATAAPTAGGYPAGPGYGYPGPPAGPAPQAVVSPVTPAGVPGPPPQEVVSPVTPAGSPASTAGRVISLIAGVLLVVFGFSLGAGGAALLWFDHARNDSGYLTSDRVTVSTPTAAVTATTVTAGTGDGQWADVTGFGDLRLRATSGEQPIFLGVARGADVDSWLSGSARDELVRWSSSNGVEYQRLAGGVRGVEPPTEQSFWLAKASGTGTIVLDWAAGDRDRYAFVLANADGSTGVAATVQAGIKIPALGPIGWGLIAGGVLFGIIGLVLLYLGASGLGRQITPPGPPPRVPPAPPAGTWPPPGSAERPPTPEYPAVPVPAGSAPASGRPG